MGYVIVATPKMEESAADLAGIVGLRVTERSPERVLLSTNARQCEVAFVPASQAAIYAVGLEAVDRGGVDEIARRAKADGFEVLADRPSIPNVDHAVRFRTPFGPILEVHTPVAREPWLPQNHPSIRAKRLDHVNLRVSDTRGFHDFATGLLGLRVSDRAEDYSRVWYRAADGFHHTLAAAPGAGLHHFGFDAFSLLDLAAVADNLVLRGRSLLWGIGRHGPGNNVFSYYLDPNGCVVETSFGMERIDNDQHHTPGVWSAEAMMRLLDVWGSVPPPNYPGALTPFVA